jgi:hypothetical protein
MHYNHTVYQIVTCIAEKTSVRQTTNSALSAEVLRLMSWLDELKSGTIQRLEVRAGIPRRLVFESRAPSRDGLADGVIPDTLHDPKHQTFKVDDHVHLSREAQR